MVAGDRARQGLATLDRTEARVRRRVRYRWRCPASVRDWLEGLAVFLGCLALVGLGDILARWW